ncbi:hypothetical protein VV01_21405 [Luteipulveratus halotolerans]|uniref:Uncharacterized protein n=2 Tax=Luteipulveratus halotolerans TaxID=1631356 RepID=A0A0L6CDT7_9MICO|nr:hypothetical protein VV01_21405 [Luteipulveratus halotolerans]
MNDLREAVNTLRADVGVGPIDEAHLRVAAGVDRVEAPALEELVEARSVSGTPGAAAERVDPPNTQPAAAGRGVPF